jgi:hypothetical protein
MKLQFKLASGDSVVLEVNVGETILNINAQLCNMFDVEVNEISFLLGGMKLDDNDVIIEDRFSPDKPIHTMFNVTPGF